MNKKLIASLATLVLTGSIYTLLDAPVPNAVPYKVTTQTKNSSGLFVELQYTGYNLVLWKSRHVLQEGFKSHPNEALCKGAGEL
jgi:hypothetical protein